MDEIKLSNRQIITATAFLTSHSIEEACRKSNISKATFYKWIKEDNFKAYLEQKRKEMVKDALDKLKLAVEKAVSVLVELTSSTHESIRRLASRDIIEYTLKSIEIEEIESRLEKVEKLVVERRSYK